MLVNWGHLEAKFNFQYKIYSTIHKAASRQITYVSYYTMLTNESQSENADSRDYKFSISYILSISFPEPAILGKEREALG